MDRAPPVILILALELMPSRGIYRSEKIPVNSIGTLPGFEHGNGMLRQREPPVSPQPTRDGVLNHCTYKKKQVFQRREADEVRFTQVHTEIAALERRVILQYGIGFFGSVIAMGLAVARIASL